MNALNGKLLLI